MYKRLSYTWLTVLTVDLLATSGDITWTWTSPIFPKLRSNDSTVNPFAKPVSEEEESWIGALINIGAMIGPLPYGFISEKWGRKLALLAIGIPHIVSYLTLAFSKTVYLYYFARILGGLAVGGGYTLLPMYVAEVAEDANRGRLSGTLLIFWTFGSLLPSLLGPYLSIMWFNVILACLPATFFVSFLVVGPETPHYLIGKNRMEEAEKSLMLLRNNDKKAVENEIQHIKSGLEKEEEKGHFLDLFRCKTYFKALVISVLLIAFNQLSGINILSFNAQDIYDDADIKGITPDVCSIIVGVTTFIPNLIVPNFVDRSGRKILLVISYSGMTLALLVLGIYFYLKNKTDVDVSDVSWLPIVSLVFYLLLFNLGGAGLPWTVSAELFPTCVKSSSSSVVSASCWIISFFITKFFNTMVDSWGLGGTFWFYSACCLVSVIFTLIMVPETKGKSFREIQDILGK